jgi:cytochrome c-type biogenesis protein CcmH
MNTIWFLLAGLIAVAMLFVLVPVWRHRGEVARSSLAIRMQKNREVFEQRQAELAVELQQNVIAPEEYTRLLAELQRAFLRDMEALESHGKTRSAFTGGKAALIGLALLIPVVSLWQYRTWGSADDLALPALLSELGNAQDEAAQSQKLNELAAFLQERFERRPADIQNGYMLGTLYIELERFAEAALVLRQTADQMEPSPDRTSAISPARLDDNAGSTGNYRRGSRNRCESICGNEHSWHRCIFKTGCSNGAQLLATAAVVCSTRLTGCRSAA